MFKRILSMAMMPWIVCLATTNSLFLTNQADLNYDLRLYVPFTLVFLAATASGVGLLAASERVQAFRPAIWGFHLFGLGFLVFMSARNNDSFVKREVMWLAILIAVIVFLVARLRRADPMRVVPAFALLAALIIATDAFRLVREYEFSVADRVVPAAAIAGESTTVAGGAPTSDTVSRRPNVYHIVLDAYQSDIFPLTLDAKTRNELGGFTWFPNTITTSGRTRISIPSIFAGKVWDNTKESVAEFTASSMTSSKSLLHALKESSYKTTAYMHKRYSFDPNIFDEVFYHHNAARHRSLGDAAFYKLWGYRFLPRVVSHRLLDTESLTEIVHRNLSPIKYAVASYDTYLSFSKREADLPAHNRYTFVHLLLPHRPYVLNCECEYRDTVEPLEQFCCATRLMVSLIQLLKELGRFEDALIIIQSDHGLNFAVGVDNALTAIPFQLSGLEWNTLRAKALLLIKPPGTTAAKPLATVDVEATTLDVTPTIYRTLALTEPGELDGITLFPTPVLRNPRKRFYHYFTSDYIEEVYRFVSERGVFRFDRILRPPGFYSNIPTMPIAKTVEAEAGFVAESNRGSIGADRADTSGQYVEGGSIYYKVNVEAPGNYRLKTRVIVDKEDRRGFHVSVDEMKYQQWRLSPCTKWEWQTSPFVLELAMGEHVLIIRQKGRDPMDQIELVRVP